MSSTPTIRPVHTPELPTVPSVPAGATRARPLSRLLTWIAVFLFVTGFVYVTGSDVGLTNDAPGWIIYPSQQEGQWISELLSGNLSRAFDKQHVDEMWTVPIKEYDDQVQPPFARTWFCTLGFKLFGERLGLIDSYRMGAATLSGVFMAFLLPWLTRRYGWFVAAAAGIMLLLSPRILVNAQYVAWDMPVSILIILYSLAFIRGMYQGRWLLFFFLFGLAFITKLTGLFFVAPLLFWAWIVARTDPKVKRPDAFNFIILWGLVSGLTILALWPDLWKNPIFRLAAYFYQFTSPRGASLYLGEYFSSLSSFDFIRYATPWHYPFVIALTTTPLPALILMATGITAALLRWRKDSAGLLFVLAGGFTLAMVAQSGGCAGERYIVVGLMFLTIVSAIGYDVLLRACLLRFSVKAPSTGLLTSIRLVALTGLTVWMAASVWITFPHGLVYYNRVLGGPEGAMKTHGMESAYWTTYLNQSAWNFINKDAKSGDKIQLLGMINGSPGLYQRENRLRQDIEARIASPCPASTIQPGMLFQADYLLVCTYEELSTRNYLQPEFTELLEANAPTAFQIAPGNVPLLKIFRRVDLLAQMTRFDSTLFTTGLAVNLESATLNGYRAQNFDAAPGGIVYPEFLFTAGNTTNPATPFDLVLLDAAGQIVAFEDRERSHKVKRFQNTVKKNPEFGYPVVHPYGVKVYADMNGSLPPMAFGAGRTYRLRMPMKIPVTLPGGTYRIAAVPPRAAAGYPGKGTTVVGNLTLSNHAPMPARTRLMLAWMALAAAGGGTVLLVRKLDV